MFDACSPHEDSIIQRYIKPIFPGDPTIFIGQAPTPGTLFVKTINLSDADVEQVASRLLETLTGPA